MAEKVGHASLFEKNPAIFVPKKRKYGSSMTILFDFRWALRPSLFCSLPPKESCLRGELDEAARDREQLHQDHLRTHQEYAERFERQHSVHREDLNRSRQDIIDLSKEVASIGKTGMQHLSNALNRSHETFQGVGSQRRIGSNGNPSSYQPPADTVHIMLGLSGFPPAPELLAGASFTASAGLTSQTNPSAIVGSGAETRPRETLPPIGSDRSIEYSVDADAAVGFVAEAGSDRSIEYSVTADASVRSVAESRSGEALPRIYSRSFNDYPATS
jgi:hypothetical protein